MGAGARNDHVHNYRDGLRRPNQRGSYGGLRRHIALLGDAPRGRYLRCQNPALDDLGEMAGQLGERGAYSMIAGFHCLQMTADDVADAINNRRHEDHVTVMNALAWFALEEVSRAYSDMLETA